MTSDLLWGVGGGGLKGESTSQWCQHTICQRMHATDGRSTLSTRPLIARDAEEHMLGKEVQVSCVSGVRPYGSYKLGYIN